MLTQVMNTMIADQKLQKCPWPGCNTKRLQAEQPPEEPNVLIGIEAKKEHRGSRNQTWDSMVGGRRDQEAERSGVPQKDESV